MQAIAKLKLSRNTAIQLQNHMQRLGIQHVLLHQQKRVEHVVAS